MTIRAKAPLRDLGEDFPTRAAAVLAALRERAPRVHCITNVVAQSFTANLLLALGAAPSMTLSEDEIEDFVTEADALLVNLGTFDAQRRMAAPIAIAAAKKAGIPWALDPVFIERSPKRAEFARSLLDFRPDLVRANGEEMMALFGLERARDRYGFHDLVVAETGEVDRVEDGRRGVSILNGHPLMAKVTAMGCAGGAAMAAFLAVEPDAFLAASCALVVLGVAGERAGKVASGPGSFAVAYLDAIHDLDEARILKRARVAA